MNKKVVSITAVAVIIFVTAVLLLRVISVFIRKPLLVENSGSAASPDPKVEGDYWRVASELEKKQDLVKLKDVYAQILEKFPTSPNSLKAQEAAESNNIRLLFSGAPTDDSFFYEVKKGDTLTGIARKFGTTVELIKRSNGMKSGMLNIGRKLKVTKLKFSIVVDKSQNILTLKADGNVIKTYRVSTGKNSCTPVGSFKVINRIIDPPWYKREGVVIKPGDPKNELGSRWLGISKPSYGIHGTIEPQSIGKSVTEGCVRLRNEDVE